MTRKTVFVFGSNLLGIHGAGAAKYAKDFYGAETGRGEGLTGDAYALPTCSRPGVPLTIGEIEIYARTFRECALSRPDLDFLLTAVGCGLAGHKTAEIANLFRGLPDNVYIQSKLAYGLEC